MARRRIGSGTSPSRRRGCRAARFGRLGFLARGPSARVGIAGRATTLAALLILVGAVAVFLPYLLRKRSISGGVPAPPALFAVTEYPLAPGARACMGSVAVEPGVSAALFGARPTARAGAPSPRVESPASQRVALSGSRPPVELSLSAPGYSASGLADGGRGYKELSVAIEPPQRALLATACFTDRGSVPVALDGSSEARTVSRSAMTLAGAPVVGDVALAFSDRPRRSLLSSLRVLFGRVSRLTDGLMPVWLIWALAALIALGVPIGILLALYLALREDEEALSARAAGRGC